MIRTEQGFFMAVREMRRAQEAARLAPLLPYPQRLREKREKEVDEFIERWLDEQARKKQPTLFEGEKV
jgi:hypothetical protein